MSEPSVLTYCEIFRFQEEISETCFQNYYKKGKKPKEELQLDYCKVGRISSQIQVYIKMYKNVYEKLAEVLHVANPLQSVALCICLCAKNIMQQVTEPINLH